MSPSPFRFEKMQLDNSKFLPMVDYSGRIGPSVDGRGTISPTNLKTKRSLKEMEQGDFRL